MKRPHRKTKAEKERERKVNRAVKNLSNKKSGLSRFKKHDWVPATKRVYGKKSEAKKTAKSWSDAGHYVRVKKVKVQVGTSPKSKVKGYRVFTDTKHFKTQTHY